MENFLLQRELTISCSRTERGKHMQLGIRLHDIKKHHLRSALQSQRSRGFVRTSGTLKSNHGISGG